MEFHDRWGPAGNSTPRLALSLRVLARDVEQLWPDRRTEVDGWIGDRRHATRSSDHNPDSDGIVHAIDLTVAGMRPDLVVVAAVRHPSTFYVIWKRIIWSRTHGFEPRAYHGANAHRDHLHVSIIGDGRAERNTRHWLPSHL